MSPPLDMLGALFSVGSFPQLQPHHPPLDVPIGVVCPREFLCHLEKLAYYRERQEITPLIKAPLKGLLRELPEDSCCGFAEGLYSQRHFTNTT